jgi:putative NADPH-quinone reductase
MQCLIIVAHPHTQSFENNKLVKTITMSYKKKGCKVMVVDLYRDDYNPLIGIDNAFSKSYRHLVKTSNEICIISTERWYGLLPIVEGFIEQVFVEGFAYKSNQQLLTKKKLNLIITHDSTESNKWKSLNILKWRLKYLVFSSFFKVKNIKVHQIWNVNHKTNVELNRELQKILTNI